MVAGDGVLFYWNSHIVKLGEVSLCVITRTKTSIRYTKENDREKRERRRERERKVEGEI